MLVHLFVMPSQYNRGDRNNGEKKTGREIIETSSVQKIRFDFHVIYVPSELMHSSFRQPHSKIEALRLSHVYNNATI